MADNVAITAGSGTTIAADDVGGVLHQRVKLSVGADGTANDLNVGAGAVATGTPRVTLASDDPAVTALATVNTSINSVNAQLPTVLGSAASAVSLSVTQATEDQARIGIITETAPATDTASSGLNGRLQRIAQRLSSFIALFTATAAADANRLPVDQRDTLVINGTATSAATLFSQDLTGYDGIIVQITSAGSACTITYEASEDNTTWYSYPGFDVTNATTAASATTTALGMRAWSRKSRYFRARVSTYGSGTVTVVASATKAPVLTYLNTFIANTSLASTGAAAHDAAISLAPVRVAGRGRNFGLPYTATSVDDVNDLVTNLIGHLKTTQEYSFSNLKANATTTIKSGAGVLHSISVNTKGITNTATVYDNTAGSGTTIATIDTTLGQDTLLYDCVFATGLTVVIAGGTAADITFTYN